MARRGEILMLLTNALAPDPRVDAEARALAESGYRVRVVCWDRDNRWPAIERAEGREVRRVRVRAAHAAGVRQVPRLLGFWLGAVLVGLRGRFGAVHCHDLDTLPVGWLLARLRGARLVFDAHESYVEMMAGHLPERLLAVLRRVEGWLLRRCDLVITVGRVLAEELARRGAKRVVVVGNYKSLAAFRLDRAAVRRLRRELDLAAEALVIGHVGNLGRERVLGPLIEAVGGDRRFTLLLGGDGAQGALARRAARTHGNVRYLGAVEADRVAGLTACCDVVYYGLDPAWPNARYSAPNKLFEALAAGRAVLTGRFGEIGEVVQKHGCGVALPELTAGAIRSALERLADREALGQMQVRAAWLGQVRYNWAAAARQLVGAYRTLNV